jgi:hypothetical protein
VATTKLVDKVFHNYQPGNDGMEFGKGLSPFSIICKGHAGVVEALRQVQKASIVTPLADAHALIAEDTRFPTRAYSCGEAVSLVHGSQRVPRAQSPRCSVGMPCSAQPLPLPPALGITPGAGVELICLIMYDMQQDYYFYLNKLGFGLEAVVPMFKKVLGLVATQWVLAVWDLWDPWTWDLD